MRIRRARPSEAGEIADVLNVQFESGSYSKAFLKKYLNTKPKIAKDMRSCEYFVAEDNGIAGVISLKLMHGTCKIDDLAVKSGRQREGIGTKLVLFAESYAKRKGCNKIWCTSSGELNASGFYKKLNFEVEGILRKHFEGKDIIHLGKLL